MKSVHPIWYVERKYLAGIELTPHELEIARTTLTSGGFDERVIACEAILRTRCGQELKALALDAIQDLCHQVVTGRTKCNPTLVLVALLVPMEILLANPLKEFAYVSSKSDDAGCRINAVLLLEQLVRGGDNSSLGLLEKALTDADELVRSSAQSSLARAQPNGLPPGRPGNNDFR